MKELLSHYSSDHRKELKDHLLEVAEKSRELILDKNLNLSILSQNKLADISYFIGILHDFGKTTTYFQNYLIHGEGSNLSHHGLISAIAGYCLLKNKYNERLAMLGYMVIKKHHGNLESPLESNERIYFDLQKQLDNIKKNNFKKIEAIYDILLADFDITIKDVIEDVEYFLFDEEDVGEYFREEIIMNKFKDESKAVELFLINNLLYSVLIDSDKKNAARVNDDYFEGAKKEKIKVKDYLDFCRKNNPDKFNPEKPINSLRNNFFDDLVNNSEISLNQYLYTLTAPTGIGKTFASFAFANKINSFYENGRRVIYCLPYTSIIDQNYAEFEKIIKFNLKDKYDAKPTKYLLRHHYLSPLKIEENVDNKDDSKESKDLDNYLANKLLLESWESGNIVTTFVQLLESIIGNRNSYLKKFHNIVNSVVILDEVQNIPVKFYQVAGKVLNIFAEKFNTYILLMTATQPDILSGNGVVNLIDERKYAEDPVFDRVNLKLLNELDPFSMDEFIDYFDSNFNSDNCLIVCNTINSALKIHAKLKDKSNDYKVYSLTTNLIPADRKDRINNIDKELKAGEKVIVISTQLIEAGVDLSFKEVYRDFGPLDSIVQVAGRCNRNNEYENKGKVNIIKLKDEKDREFSKRIYDNKLLDICKKVLSENTSFLDMSQSYFAKVNDSFTRDNKYLMNAIKNLNYSKKRDKEIPIKDFTIIEEQAGKEDIIICKDEGVELKVRNLIELYEEIKETKDNKKLNRLIAQKELINKELANYRVSVYRNQLEKYYSDYQIVKEFKYLRYIDYEDQKEYLYDENIGFLSDPKMPPPSSLVF